MGVPPPLPHPPMRRLESSAGSQLPPVTLHRPNSSKGSAEPRASTRHPPALSHSTSLIPTFREPVLVRGDPENARPSAASPHLLTSLLSSFIQLRRSAVPSGSRGSGVRGSAAGAGRGESHAASPAGEEAGSRRGRREGSGAVQSLGRTGPGRQCAFVYVARSAAANMHLKSARVSARQRPAVQSPSRRAPRTPGPRSLWYISDLTSRLGMILRWERFCVHLGSPLGWFLYFFFPKEV